MGSIKQDYEKHAALESIHARLGTVNKEIAALQRKAVWLTDLAKRRYGEIKRGERPAKGGG